MERVCLECGSSFEAPKSEILRGNAKYCSKQCYQVHNHGNQGKPAWNKGLTKEDPRIASMVEKQRTYMLENPLWDRLTAETKDIIKLKTSIALQRRYASGWMPKAGRCKKISYTSPFAGRVLLDGSWELITATWLDSNFFKWSRNTNRFPYMDCGKLRYYTPDFFLSEFNSYLEVKGFETDLDRLKWGQFPHRLIVLRKKEILNMKKNPGKLAEWLKALHC